MAQFQLGSVSTGTLRPQDLLPAFESAYEMVNPTGKLAAFFEDIDEHLTLLEDEINNYCPPFVYFGAHEGDGADFGFWIAFDALDEERQYGDATENPEETYLPESNVLVHVNDHGNVTCLDMKRNVLWSCV